MLNRVLVPEAIRTLKSLGIEIDDSAAVARAEGEGTGARISSTSSAWWQSAPSWIGRTSAGGLQK
jgi:hypothetical protein